MRFYGHLAACYGTLWFVVMVAAVVSQSHINTGEFGLFGFPIIAAIYAMIRIGEPDPREELKQQVHYLQEKLDQLR